MDLIKKFMKIGGFKTREELEAYGEDRFFNDFPQAKQYAKGGAIEAFPQIATFKNAFSYGVPPGPQYLAHGGSAFPQAQTEQQFFIPIYTDVYNPYNKAMGGSNVEMYPNAKTTPHWGPTNTWFQDGGQQQQQDPQALVQQIAQALQKGMKPQQIAAELMKTGMPQDKAMQAVQMVMQEMQQMAMQQQAPQQEPMPEQMPEQPMMEKGGTTDGKISTTGEKRLKYLTNTVKNVAEIAVQDKITKNATQQFRAGGLVKYQGDDPNQGSQTPAYLTKDQMPDILSEWWKSVNADNKQQLYGPGPQGPPVFSNVYYDKQNQQQMYYPPYGPGYNYYPQPYAQPYYYPQPQYDMRGLMPDLYAYSMSNSFPGASRKTRFSIDGQRAGKFYSNMELIKAMYPELYGRRNFEELYKNGEFKNRADAVGLSYYKKGKFIFPDEYVFNASIPIKNSDLPSVKDPGPKPAAPQNTTTMGVNDLISMIDKMPSQTPGATPPAQSKQGVPSMLQDDPSYRAQPQAPGYTNPMSKFMPQAPVASAPGAPSMPAPSGSPASPASPGAATGQPAAQPMPAPTTGVGPMRGEFMYPEDVQSEPQLGPYIPGSTRQTMLDPSRAAAPSPATWNNPVANMMPPVQTGPTPQDYGDFAGKSPYAPFSVSPDNYRNTYSGNTVGDLPGNTVPAPSPAAPSRPSLMPPPAAPAPSAPVAPRSGASTVTGQFDMNDASNMVRENELNYFDTRSPKPGDRQFNNGSFDPMAWQSQVPYGTSFYNQDDASVFLSGNTSSPEFNRFIERATLDPNEPGLSADVKQKRVDARNKKIQEGKEKGEILKSYSGVPDPLKDIAVDHLFNSGYDPRVGLLAAAGAIDWKDRTQYYKQKDPKNAQALDKIWNDPKTKALINQQYNDDPQAFTESVSAYRDMVNQRTNPQERYMDLYNPKTKKRDLNLIQTPGKKYPAWKGRTQATQNYIDSRYFDPAQGYVAPQFFQRYGGLPKAQFGPQEFSDSPLLSPDVNSNQLVEVQGTSSFPDYNWNTGSVAADTPSFQDMVDIGKYEKPIEMDLESEPLSKKLRFDFLEGKNWGSNFDFNEVQAGVTGATDLFSGDGFQVNRMDMTDPALLAERRKEAMNPSRTLSKGLQAPNSNEMYGPFGQRSLILQDNYTPKGVRMASGGNVKQNDVVYWDEDTIREFIANCGQVEYLD